MHAQPKPTSDVYLAHYPRAESLVRLASDIEEAERTHETITITRQGRPAAVLMAADDFGSLHETLIWLSEPGLREDITAARQAVVTGTTVSADELRAEFGLKE